MINHRTVLGTELVRMPVQAGITIGKRKKTFNEPKCARAKTLIALLGTNATEATYGGKMRCSHF